MKEFRLPPVITLSIIIIGCVASPTRIDKARLLSHVETLSSDIYMGRQTGTDGGIMAQTYVKNEMEIMNLNPCLETLQQPFSFNSRRSETQFAGVNMVGIVEGTGSSVKTMAVTAHFDHLGTRNEAVYNGADDNASGTAAMLEIARYFTLNPPVHTIIFAGLDAEEMGLQGARALVDSPCIMEREVAIDFNMDMISRSTKGELYVSGTRHYPGTKAVLEDLSPREGLTLLLGHDEPGTGSEDWTSASDHGPFHQADIPFLYFGVEDHPGYHQPTDDFQDITPEFYYQAAELILETILKFDAQLDSISFK